MSEPRTLGITRKEMIELLRQQDRFKEVPASAYLEVYEGQEADDDVVVEFRWREDRLAAGDVPA